MAITSIRLRNFRNHTDISCEFSPDTNLIHGANGSGKTSILEAVYSIYRGASFRATAGDIIRRGAQWCSVQAEDETSRRSLGYSVDKQHQSIEKKITVDTVEYMRLPQKFKRPVVLFTPDDLQLTSGSPARRRRYLDTIITQSTPGYATTLRRYERAVTQRNNLLKSSRCTPDTIFSWNLLVAEYGSNIIQARIRLIEQMQRSITERYRLIAQTDDLLEVAYSARPVSAKALLAQLEQSYVRDRDRGVTLVGPHRHDMNIFLNSSDVMATASRGETRSIILTMKQIEAAVYEEQLSINPIVLLDDVFGELDTGRRHRVADLFPGSQTIITSVDDIEVPGKTIRIT